METLTSVQQPMEFPHLMGVAVQPSKVLYVYVLYRNITSIIIIMLQHRASEGVFYYIGGNGCVLQCILGYPNPIGQVAPKKVLISEIHVHISFYHSTFN